MWQVGDRNMILCFRNQKNAKSFPGWEIVKTKEKQW